MIVRCVCVVTLLCYLTACYNSNDDDLSYSDSVNITKYYNEAKTETDPIEAYKDAFTQLRIMHQNKTDIKTVSYDSCLNKALSDKINFLKTKIELNVIDYDYLNYLALDSVKFTENDVLWNFMHSKNFDLIQKIDDVGDNKELATVSLAHLRKVMDNRFTLILHKKAKILPRTKKPNYVLGSFFEGYALLYDIKTHQVICYFNYRINNTSNRREDYADEGRQVFENMMLEMKSTHHSKLKKVVAEKLRLEEFQIELGFVN